MDKEGSPNSGGDVMEAPEKRPPLIRGGQGRTEHDVLKDMACGFMWPIACFFMALWAWAFNRNK